MRTVFQKKKSTRMKYAVILTLGIFLSLSLKATTIYVNYSATGSNNGTSWANAYISFQSVLNGTVSGDQIWVSDGTYKHSNDYGMGARYFHFEMIEGVAIYGGFAGTESSVSQLANYYSNTSPHIKGGGIFNRGAFPTIRNCTFSKNQDYIAIEGSGEVFALGE